MIQERRPDNAKLLFLITLLAARPSKNDGPCEEAMVCTCYLLAPLNNEKPV
jgi:hypothetical protein